MGSTSSAGLAMLSRGGAAGRAATLCYPGAVPSNILPGKPALSRKNLGGNAGLFPAPVRAVGLEPINRTHYMVRMSAKPAPYKTLGLLIANARRAAGFERQGDLADRIAASQQAVSRWEAGLSRPRQDQLSGLANALKVNIARLHEAGNYAVPAEILPDRATISFDQDMPVDALSPEAFERLVEEVVRTKYRNAREVRRAGGRGHTQGGIDILAELADGSRVTVQCKRATRFGPAEVDAAAAAQTEPADIKILALSRVASPQTAAAVRAHDWVLWDKQDLSRMIRELDRLTKLRIVDTYFPGQRMALLGVMPAGPWQTPDEFFAPFAAKLAAFRHDWPLVGRQSDMDALVARVRAGEGRIIFLEGTGGGGKSRLLKELVDRLRIEAPELQVLFASPTEPLTAAAMQDLGQGPKLLVVDDAHDRNDIPMLISYAAQVPVRVLIATRPYALARLRGQAGTFGYADAIDTVSVHPLSLDEAIALAENILRSYGGPRELAEPIARATKDCPLVTVMAARIAATENLPPGLAMDSRVFRDTILGKFAEVITGNLAGPGDQKALNDILEVISLVQPFGMEDAAFRGLVTTVTGLDEHVVSRLLRLMAEGGILYRRGHQYRLMPDLLGDFIIERSCLTPEDRLNTLADRVFNAAPRDLLGNVLVNLGRLDWRRNSGDVSKNYLVDHLWRALLQGTDHRDAALDAATAAAFYNPRQALRFVEQQMDEGKTPKQLSIILKRVSYHQEYVRPACELLWELGRDDGRKENPHPEHGVRVLKELVAVEPDKPISFNRAAVDFGLSLLAQPDAFSYSHSPFDFLSGILSGEGHTDSSDGFSIVMRAFEVNYDAVKELRRQVIDAAFRFLEQGPPVAAGIAADFIGNAVRYPMGILGQRIQDSTLDKYTAEFVETLERLRVLVASGRLHDAVMIGIADSISWHANYATRGTKAKAREIMDALPNTLEFRTLGALADGWGQIFVGRMDANSWQARVNKWMADLCADLQGRFPDPAELFRFVEDRLKRLAAFSTGRKNSSSVLVHQLISTRPDFAAYLVETAFDQTDALLAASLGTALFFYFQTDAEAAREAARRLFDSGNPPFQMAVGHALSNPHVEDGRLAPADFDLLIRVLGSSDKRVVVSASHVFFRLAEVSTRLALDMLRYVNFHNDAGLIDSIFMVFHGGRDDVFNAMTTADVDFLLGKLRDVPELDGHWVETLLSHLSRFYPEQTLRFFMERVELAAQEDQFNRIRPINYGPWTHVRLRFREADRFHVLLDRVWDWVVGLDTQNWRYTHNAAALFEAIALPVDANILDFLAEKIATAGKVELSWIAKVLSHTDNEFVFTHSDFVIAFLDACDRAGRTARRDAAQELFRSWLNGVRTSFPGEPTQIDIEATEKTEMFLSRLTPGTGAHELYRMIRSEAERSIKDAEWERERFSNG